MAKRHLGLGFALILACAGFFVAQEMVNAQENGSWDDVVVEAIEAGEISKRREQEAVNLAFEYMLKNGSSVSDDIVVGAILPDFKKANPEVAETPKTPLLTVEDCAKAAAISIKKAADEKFPLKTDEQLAEDAKVKYPLYKVGDRVTVFFGKNPQVPSEARGVYYGTVRGFVQVGTSRIRIDDMRRIKDYKDEVLKFDPDSTEILRKEYIKRQQRQNLIGHQEFIDENSEAIIQAEIKAFAEKNEKNGYTCIDDNWLSLRPFMNVAVGKARSKLAAYQAEQLQKRVDERLDTVEAQAGTLAIHWTAVPPSARLNPTAVLKEIALREKNKAEAEAKRKADEQARIEAAEAAEREAEEKRKEAEAAKAAAAAAQSNEPSEDDEIRRQEEASRKQMTMMITAACIALLVLVAVVLIILKIRANREKTRFKRFFEGKGKLQKDFWDMAAADPKNFKYVAYLFPDLKEASKALTRLSYIQALPNGELKSTRDIMFGVYPHQNGAVAFLGGTKFHYALWREASAVLPELEGASYFKVSEEPEVMLDIPDIKSIGADGEIESLGVEDATDAEGSFTRCYKYRIHNRETAMTFLENFQINEEGIVVQVETDEGVLGKDENGIFTA